jgi:hypothetical protein
MIRLDGLTSSMTSTDGCALFASIAILTATAIGEPTATNAITAAP